MSIPGFFLAVWAKPGTEPYVNLIRKLAHFVIPAVLSLTLVGFVVYLLILIMTDDLVYAQMSLTYVAITCGTLLLIFVEPPNMWWVGGDKLSGDWRPTFLAIGLLILFAVFLIGPAHTRVLWSHASATAEPLPDYCAGDDFLGVLFTPCLANPAG